MTDTHISRRNKHGLFGMTRADIDADLRSIEALIARALRGGLDRDKSVDLMTVGIASNTMLGALQNLLEKRDGPPA